jgi:hypothetical protein
VGERGELTGCSKGGVQRDRDVRGPENNGLAERSGVLDMRDVENDALLRLPGLAAECVCMAVEDTERLGFIKESLDAEGEIVGLGGAALWSVTVDAADAELSGPVEFTVAVDG